VTLSYASSSEIQSYLKAVVLHYQLDKFITFNSKIERATWNAQTSRWTIKVEGDGAGEYESEILINAGGILNHPAFPNLKGLESFKGQLAHTAAWDPAIGVSGKRVAVVGAGASAIQVLPALQSKASHIDIYIRTPSWITPPAGANFSDEFNHTFTAAEIERFAQDDQYSLATRKDMEASFNAMYRAFRKDSEQQREMRSRIETRMRQLIHDKDLQNKLIPSFEAGCRRLNPGERYLEALQRSNVEPVFDPIESVTSDGIRDGNGTLRPVDVIVAATGFDTSFRPRFPIVGLDGRDLREVWKDDPASYCGLAVSGFPNYLIFLGPNTPISNGSLIGALEATGDYFVRLIRKTVMQRATSFDVRSSVQADFNDHAQEFMQDMVWTGSCRSWFKNSRGKVTAVWPGSGLHYREVLQSDRWEDFRWKYDGNRFAYWDKGFSQLEKTTGSSPPADLSYYIRPHPNLPLEALRRVHDDGKGQHQGSPVSLLAVENGLHSTDGKERRGGEVMMGSDESDQKHDLSETDVKESDHDNRSDKSASSSPSQGSQSDAYGAEVGSPLGSAPPQLAFLSDTAAFSV
jgi:cation diffusion facilitator CzcD-associated flavoprotein CzcO